MIAYVMNVEYFIKFVYAFTFTYYSDVCTSEYGVNAEEI
jgi:hypothetical protein